ncbi:hypothetical protein ACFS07_01180 [Undibacterium arcticum]
MRRQFQFQLRGTGLPKKFSINRLFEKAVEGRIENASGLKPAGPTSEGAPQSIRYSTPAGQSYPQAGGLFSAAWLQSRGAA